MKRTELVFNLISIPLDAVMVLVSAVFAYLLRLHFSSIWPIAFEIQPIDYIKTIVLITPFLLLLFGFYGLYSLRSTDKLGSELTRVIAGVATGLMLIVLIFFFDRDIFPSRLIVLLSGVTTVTLVSVGRIVLRLIRDRQLRKGYGAHRVVVIEGEQTDKNMVQTLNNSLELGYSVVATLSSRSPDLFKNLDEIHSQKDLDELLQADPNSTSIFNSELVRFCHDRGIRFNFAPDVFGVASSRMEVEMIGSYPIIKLKGTPLEGWGRVLKRLVDVILSGAALVALFPVYVIVFLAVRLDSPGRAIYAAPRAGWGTDFTFYKFRSMYAHLSPGAGYGGDEAQKMRLQLIEKINMRTGPVPKFNEDPRITRVGSILRKTKLDEIPQFWNVLKGDMSLVGPRAHLLDEVEKYRDVHRRLFTIKPGITGVTQIVQMQKPDLPFEEEVRLDTYYIENWSLWLDIKLMWKTFWILVTRKFKSGNY